jgi:hypothetical protein
MACGGNNGTFRREDLSAPGAFGAAAYAGLCAGGRSCVYVYRVVDAFKSKTVFRCIGFCRCSAIARDGKPIDFFGIVYILEVTAPKIIP